MEPWFTVKQEDVIALLERRKDCFPWGDRPDEKYRCLVFREDGVIRMTVDDFYDRGDGSYECLRPYTAYIGDSIGAFDALTEEELVTKAYNAWCSGAR